MSCSIGLPDADREAVLLRYVQGHSLAEVGAAIGLNPESARKRIERAVDRLRAILAKRGLMTSAGVVAELQGAAASGAAPVQLVERLANVALKNALPATSSASLGGAAAEGAAMSGAAAIGLSLAVIAIGGSAIGFAVHRARTAEALFASTEQSCRDGEARVAALQAELTAPPAKVTAAGSVTTTTQAPKPIKRASTGAASPVPGTPEARANGARFLATVPGARAGLLSFLRTQQHVTYSGFYRAAGLTPFEIQAFEQRVADYRLASVELTHHRLETTAGDLPVDQVRALLGADRATLYEEYLPTMPARFLALEAAAGGYNAEPVSPAQVDEMTRILVEANGAHRSGGAVDPAMEDWSSAVPALKALLTPSQWTAVEGFFAQQQYEQLLRRLQSPTPAVSVVGTEGAPKS